MVPVSRTLISCMKSFCQLFGQRQCNTSFSILNHLRFMAGHMAVDIDCTRHTCNMSGHGLNVQSDGRGLSAEALRSDTELVDLVQHFHLPDLHRTGPDCEESMGRINAFFARRAAFVKGTSDAHTHNHRRTWVRACGLY